ncbi:hypothetical protein H2201_001584 [Coniosporium apollinis]|uniref:Uncharacterized protein n=1 Tax=Coniosporium apollinis TaxID=61459 RepID=A0ABQ9P3K3_9PEZI|nr:hypothetical protein H2201_001584 [Coniosporium apollinis]
MKKFLGIGGAGKEKKGTHDIDRRREETKREETKREEKGREESRREEKRREESKREEKADEGFEGGDALDIAEEFRDHDKVETVYDKERKAEVHEVEGPATFNHHFDHEISHSGNVGSSKLPKSAGDKPTYIEPLKNTSLFPKELLSANGTSNYLRNIAGRMHETSVDSAYIINRPAPEWKIADFKDKPWMVPAKIQGQKKAISGIREGLQRLMAAEGIDLGPENSLKAAVDKPMNLVITFEKKDYKSPAKLVEALASIYLDQGAVAMYNRLETKGSNAISFSNSKPGQSEYINQLRTWELCQGVVDKFVLEHMRATEPKPKPYFDPTQPFESGYVDRGESRYDKYNPFNPANQRQPEPGDFLR